MIGGGNYFELWVKNSPTGTSIAIPLKLFKKIKVPIFFNALGVDLGMGASNQTKKNFRYFVNQILSSDQYLLSVRNDGSLNNIKKILEDNCIRKIYLCPDHGFFVKKKKLKILRLKKKIKILRTKY